MAPLSLYGVNEEVEFVPRFGKGVNSALGSCLTAGSLGQSDFSPGKNDGSEPNYTKTKQIGVG